MRARRGAVIAAVAAGGAVTTMLVGLVTNAVSESQWPGWLGWLQDHAWLSFAALGAAMVGLSVLLAALSEAGGAPAGAPHTPLPGPVDGTQPPGAALVLRSLPRDTAAFTDRGAELDALVRSVRESQGNGTVLPVHVIDGMPGVGKTTFAVHAGHVLSECFPDGQLFVNLNGHTTGRAPVQATEALASLLAATGVPTQQIPVGDDEGAVTEARAAMWRSHLAGRRALLILDNAVSYRQLEPLLPGGRDCLVLVTSRRRLAAYEEVVVSVDALPPEHAADLFVRLSGRPPESLDRVVIRELAAQCGHLPLGISLLAARLRHHPSWSVRDLRSRLVAASNRLGEFRAGERGVAATFELSYRDLEAGRQYFFRCLGCYPGTDLDAYSGAALAAVSLSVARDHLDGLYDAHLIDEHPGNRYRLHDLLSDYARALADEGGTMEHTEAVHRVGTYYLAALAAANQHILRGGAPVPALPDGGDRPETPPLGSRSAALGWLEDERANVLACIRRANGLRLHDLVIRMATAMAPFLRQAGPWDQAVGLHRTAVEAARQTGDRRALAAALAELGVIRRFMAAYPEAIEALDQAIAEYEAVGEKRGKAEALNQLGIVRYMIADNEAAAEAQTESLSLFREAGDRLGQANALADLGMVRRQCSRFDAAVEAQSEALTIYRELDDRYGEANSLRDLGILHSLMGGYEPAARCQREALEIYRDLDDRVHQAYALNELGVVHRLTGDFGQARSMHTRAQEYYTELGERFGHANSVCHLGVLDRVEGRVTEAVALLEQALAAYRELGSRGGEAAALGALGAARAAAGERDGAAEALGQSLAILRSLGDRCGEAQVLNHYGNLLRASGDQAGARDHHTDALRLARDIRCPLEEGRALEGMGRCDRVTLGPERAAESLREALEIFRRIGAETEADAVRTLLAAQPG